jgi:hypothetical protein
MFVDHGVRLEFRRIEEYGAMSNEAGLGAAAPTR